MTTTVTPVDLELVMLAVDDLHPADDNPRHDLGDLTELAASIASIGILQPLVVVQRDVGGGFTIVAGHRRHAAARIAGVEQVPCVVRTLGHEERNLAMLVENLQRKDLDPLDEAAGFAKLTELGLSQRAIAERVGCNQSHVSRRLALVKLPDAGVELLRSGRLHVRQAEQLAALDETDVDDVVAKIAGDADGHSEEVPAWHVDRAIKKVAEERKRAAAIAAAEATPKVKRLKKDPRYDYAWQTCKKADATHWWIDDYGSATVHWVRKKPKDDAAAGPSEHELERQRCEAAIAERVRCLVDALDADERTVCGLGLEYAVDRVCGTGWNARVTLDGGDLHRHLTDGLIADLTDDRPLFVAVAALISTVSRGIWQTIEGDDEHIARWSRIAELADAVGIKAGDGEVSLDDTPDAELPGMWERADFEGGATDVNEQFALVDGQPPAPAVRTCRECRCTDEQACEGGCSWADDDLCTACVEADGEVDESEPPAVDVVQEPEAPQVSEAAEVDDGLGFFDPIDPPKRPWPTYDGNDYKLICRMVGNFTVPAAVHEVLAYEQANLNRPGVVEQCEATLAKLAD